jgi:hypothetical protein
MKHWCPIHKDRRLHKTAFYPPLGYDPKMIKLVCRMCSEYWYYAPRWSRVMAEEEAKQLGWI